MRRPVFQSQCSPSRQAEQTARTRLTGIQIEGESEPRKDRRWRVPLACALCRRLMRESPRLQNVTTAVSTAAAVQ